MAADGEGPRRISGIITDDPLRALPVGAELQFSSQLFLPNTSSSLNTVDNWDFFHGAVIALHFGSASNQRILGSGVMVAPGIALTARHVVEPEIDSIMAGQGFICTGIGPSGLMIWRPRHITLVPDADLALLTLEGASALPSMLQHATITTRLPKFGERIHIVGLRYEDSAINSADLKTNMWVAAGTVTTRYPNGRDRVMLPGPALEVHCPALGGMSGGPAFDENGFLIGLLSSSIEGHPAGGPAFVSLLWQALATKVTPPWPPGLYKTPSSLLELDRRLCGIDRPDAVEVARDEITGACEITYRVWEK
jgi:hypothetical protein